MARLRAFLPLITLCIATLIIYAGSFLGDFHYDDTLTILENPHLASLHIFLGHLDHMVRPVLYATFLIDHTLYGTRPAGYHVLNLLLHLGSGTLVYLIVTRAFIGPSLDCLVLSDPSNRDRNSDVYLGTGLWSNGIVLPVGLVVVHQGY